MQKCNGMSVAGRGDMFVRLKYGKTTAEEDGNDIRTQHSIEYNQAVYPPRNTRHNEHTLYTYVNTVLLGR